MWYSIAVLGFLGGLLVKNLPPMQEIWVQSLGQEDPLEKETTTPSSILAWEITWTGEPGGLQSMEMQELDVIQWLKQRQQRVAEPGLWHEERRPN